MRKRPTCPGSYISFSVDIAADPAPVPRAATRDARRPEIASKADICGHNGGLALQLRLDFPLLWILGGDALLSFKRTG